MWPWPDLDVTEHLQAMWHLQFLPGLSSSPLASDFPLLRSYLSTSVSITFDMQPIPIETPLGTEISFSLYLISLILVVMRIFTQETFKLNLLFGGRGLSRSLFLKLHMDNNIWSLHKLHICWRSFGRRPASKQLWSISHSPVSGGGGQPCNWVVFPNSDPSCPPSSLLTHPLTEGSVYLLSLLR